MIKNIQETIEKNKINDIIVMKYKCPYCGKMLFKYNNHSKIDGLEIKCGRCKKIISIN